MQYPLNMGNSALSADSDATQLALTMDSEGHIQYDQIIRQAHAPGQIVFSKFTDLVERVDDARLEKPSDEQAQEIAERTRHALERIVNGKIAAAHKSAPQKMHQAQGQVEDAQFYRYTPAKRAVQQDGTPVLDGTSDTVESKIIQMVEAPVDPLEPPKFRSKKMPSNIGSPPVPVMHSPPKKLTAEEAANWKIPPCISNWKNPKGFTIALDKRLAADGRGLQHIQINDRFAHLAEAMYIAEQTAREDIEKRAQYEKMKVLRDKEQREEQLRKLAQQARMSRMQQGSTVDDQDSFHAGSGSVNVNAGDDDSGYRGGSGNASYRSSGTGHLGGSAASYLDLDASYRGLDAIYRKSDNGSDSSSHRRSGSGTRSSGKGNNRDSSSDSDSDDDSHQHKRVAEREKIREQLKYEAESERRRAARKSAAAAEKSKTKKMRNDEDRDITEKVALGEAAKPGAYDSSNVDSRLYNTSSSGLDSGFGEDDSYRLYDKPLLRGSSASQIYAPRKSNIEQHQTAEELEASAASHFESEEQAKRRESARSGGPVQFEREKKKEQEKQPAAGNEADPFGFGQLLSETSSKKKQGVLDHIGKKGMMNASAGSGANRDESSMSKRSRIDFESTSSSKRRKWNDKCECFSVTYRGKIE